MSFSFQRDYALALNTASSQTGSTFNKTLDIQGRPKEGSASWHARGAARQECVKLKYHA